MKLNKGVASAAPLFHTEIYIMKPITIEAAKKIAKEFDYDQVVIIARKVGEGEHVTTYGVNKVHCDVAARMGDHLKYKVMGWTRE